jgi:hypothetical protein
VAEGFQQTTGRSIVDILKPKKDVPRMVGMIAFKPFHSLPTTVFLSSSL